MWLEATLAALLAMAALYMLLRRGRAEGFEAKGPKAAMPQVLYIGVDWCGHCRAFEASFSQLAASGLPATFKRLDGDSPEGRAAMRRLGVDAFPTVLLLQGDRKTAIPVGDPARMAAAIRRALAA